MGNQGPAPPTIGFPPGLGYPGTAYGQPMQPPWIGAPGAGFQPAYPMLGQTQMPGMVGWSSAMPSGGESDIARHYTALPDGELQKMMMGNIHPTKIYQAIPCDFVLYPVIETTDKGGQLEWDLTNNKLTVADLSGAHIREKNLKRLVKTLDSPLKFAHAWSWFVCLTNYKYGGRGLSAAMMRFGWKVVAYSINTAWDVVLRAFVEIATPMLTGNLLAEKAAFDDPRFMETLGPYRAAGAAGSVANSSTLSNTVANPGTASDTAQSAKANTAQTGQQSNKPICRRWNKGECDGIACTYRHVCLRSKQEHPQMSCTVQSATFAAPHSGYVMPPGYQPQTGYYQQPASFAQPQQFHGNQGFNGQQGLYGQQGYAGHQSYGGQSGFGAQQGYGYSNGTGNQQNFKPRGNGASQPAKGGQA